METFKELIGWWYFFTPEHIAYGLKICFFLGSLVCVTIFLYASWKDKLNKGDGFLLNTIQIMGFSFICSFLVWLTIPLLIIIGLLYLLNGGLSKWGNNYRSLEKSKEKRREEVLKDMLESDPVFMEKYKELMNSTPEI